MNNVKKVTVNLPEKIKVKDASNLTETEKEAVKQALITANPNLKDAKLQFQKQEKRQLFTMMDKWQ